MFKKKYRAVPTTKPGSKGFIIESKRFLFWTRYTITAGFAAPDQQTAEKIIQNIMHNRGEKC